MSALEGLPPGQPSDDGAEAHFPTALRWVTGELAALRVPDVSSLEQEPARAPLLTEAAERWRESRVDVAEHTANMHRSAFVRIFKVKPALRARPVDALSVADVAELIAALAAAGYKRETLRKSRTALAQTLDFCDISPNPVRDEGVKLPRERKAHLPPPLAEHVERVLGWWRGVPAPARHPGRHRSTRERPRRRASAISTRNASRSASARGPRRTSATAICNCPTISLRHSSRRSRHARTATKPRRPSRGSPTHACAWRSRVPVGSVAFRTSRRTRSGVDAARCITSATGSLAEVAELLGDSKRVAAEHYLRAHGLPRSRVQRTSVGQV